jgi:two-component system, NtrC family, sensor kinase
MKKSKATMLHLSRPFLPNLPFNKCCRWATVTLIVAVAYYGAAKLGSVLALPIPPGNVSPVWLPSPIAWTAMLLLGRRFWLGVWLGDILFSFGSFVDATGSIASASVLGALGSTGATLEAVLGALLIEQWVKTSYPFNRAQNVFKFVAIALFCPALNSTFGVTVFCLSGISTWGNFASLWYTWWVGNAISILVFVPMFLTWRQRFRLHLTAWQIAEALLLLVMLLSVGEISFGRGYPVEYLLVPCLMWAAFRFGQWGATTGTVIVSTLALWGTAQGSGVFVQESLNESLLLLQTFMGSVSATTLVLAAVLTERKRSETALEEANEQLENRVEERTAAMRQANHQLMVEIAERKQVEEALRQSQSEKVELIASLQNQTSTLENALQDLKKTQAQLIQTEKMSSLGQLVAGVAHEINNPVNFIHGNLTHANEYTQSLLALIKLYEQGYTNTHPEVQELIQAIELDFLMEDLPKLLSSMKVGAERIRQIVLTLRNFSRLDEAEVKPVDIHEGIDSTLLILQNRLKAEPNRPAIQIVKEYGELPKVECYASQLNQVFMNLINNAIDSLYEHQQDCHLSGIAARPNTITIKTQILCPNWVGICVQDNGSGMSEAVREKLFDPFFTTKPAGQGTGLGLSISHQIITEKHGGRLKCISEPEQGAEFWIEIPIHNPSLNG